MTPNSLLLTLADAAVLPDNSTSGFKAIQILLIVAVLLLFVYVMRSRSLLMTRVVGAFLFAGVTVAVMFPTLTTTIAHLVGVGRGADLVIYFSFVLFSYLFLVVMGKIRTLERDLTRLNRALAHLHAVPPDKRPLEAHLASSGVQQGAIQSVHGGDAGGQPGSA